MGKTRKTVVREMEYLMKLLEKEWQRSGRSVAVVSILIEESSVVNRRLADAVFKNMEYLEVELDFKGNLEMARENYVLLRLVRKITKAEERAGNKAEGKEFAVELDKEEYKLFKQIVGTWEE